MESNLTYKAVGYEVMRHLGDVMLSVVEVYIRDEEKFPTKIVEGEKMCNIFMYRAKEIKKCLLEWSEKGP